MLASMRKKHEHFVFLRTKFGDCFLFEEMHYDAENNSGTAKPLAELGRPKKGLVYKEWLAKNFHVLYRAIEEDRPEQWLSDNKDTFIAS